MLAVQGFRSSAVQRIAGSTTGRQHDFPSSAMGQVESKGKRGVRGETRLFLFLSFGRCWGPPVRFWCAVSLGRFGSKK